MTILNAELRKAYEESEAKAKAEAGDDEKAPVYKCALNVGIAYKVNITLTVAHILVL